MSLLSFLKPSNPTVPPPGTSAHKAYLYSTGSTPQQGASAYAAQQAVPPQGTSAYKAYQYYMENGRPSTFPFDLGGDSDSNNPSKKPYSPSAEEIAYSPVDNAIVDFVNAELAQYYGMSKETAYQEALANTSYQRAVKDMKAAGLNPAVMFGSGRADGAGSGVHVSSSFSGGSGGYSRRSGGSSKNDKLFSSSAYGAIAAIGGLVGMAATKGRPEGFWIGSQVSQGAMNLLNAFNNMK